MCAFMMIARLVVCLASYVALAACAAPADEEERSQSQMAPLRNTGAGDPDECIAMHYACIDNCSRTGGDASCYHYCDRVFNLCRGLPPELSLGAVAR
jgi:hypothetical protein